MFMRYNYIQTCRDTVLFNVSKFTAKTKTNQSVMREMSFPDDSAVLVYDKKDMQKLIDKFSRLENLQLKINIKKTEFLSRDGSKR